MVGAKAGASLASLNDMIPFMDRLPGTGTVLSAP